MYKHYIYNLHGQNNTYSFVSDETQLVDTIKKFFKGHQIIVNLKNNTVTTFCSGLRQTFLIEREEIAYSSIVLL